MTFSLTDHRQPWGQSPGHPDLKNTSPVDSETNFLSFSIRLATSIGRRTVANFQEKAIVFKN